MSNSNYNRIFWNKFVFRPGTVKRREMTLSPHALLGKQDS